MLKSHFKINQDENEEEQMPTGDIMNLEEEEDEKEIVEEQAREPEEPVFVLKLKRSQVCLRLSLLGKTADSDGYAYLKATLSNMGVTNIDIVKCFKHLQFLDVSQNLLDLAALQAVTELPYLVLLQADKNNLNSAALNKMPYLQVVIMNENKIKSVEDIFQPELSTLELGFNELKELNFKNRMPEMKVLDFRNNKITHIQNLDFPKLDSLYLAYNKITSLIGLETLINLRILHLRGNPLRLLDGFHKDLTKLNYVNFRYCKVSTMIQIKKMRMLSGLETLVVKGCPVMGGSGDEADAAEAEEDPEIRTEILASLPRLKRLNKGVFTPEEREEAKVMMMQWLEEGEKDEEEVEPEELQGEERLD